MISANLRTQLGKIFSDPEWTDGVAQDLTDILNDLNDNLAVTTTITATDLLALLADNSAVGNYLVSDAADLGCLVTVGKDNNGNSYVCPNATAFFSIPNYPQLSGKHYTYYNNVPTVTGVGEYKGVWNSGLSIDMYDVVKSASYNFYYVNITGTNFILDPHSDGTNWKIIQYDYNNPYFNASRCLTVIVEHSHTGSAFTLNEQITNNLGGTGIVFSDDGANNVQIWITSDWETTWKDAASFYNGLNSKTGTISGGGSITHSPYYNNMVVAIDGFQYAVEDETAFDGTINGGFILLPLDSNGNGYIEQATPVYYNAWDNSANGKIIVSQPADGDTIDLTTFGNNVLQLTIIADAPLDELTVTIPSTPYDQQRLNLVSTKAITALISDLPSSVIGGMTANYMYEFVWDAVIGDWINI